jgi:hypothetical protein
MYCYIASVNPVAYLLQLMAVSYSQYLLGSAIG